MHGAALRRQSENPGGAARLSRMPAVGAFAAALFLLLLAACSDRVDPAEALARGRELLLADDIASAIIELKNAVQAEPDNAEARATLGHAYLRGGDAAAALKEFRRARSLGTTSDELSRGITRALIMSGKMDEAATELALNSSDTNPDWLMLQGLLDLAVGRFEEARARFEQVLAAEPDNIEARRSAIRAAIGLGETDVARAEVDAALKVTEDDYDVWILKGDLDRSGKNYAAAIEAYTRALGVIPGSPMALLQRAGARVANDDIDGAIKDLDALGEASNQDPRAVYLRALIAAERGQDNTALRYLRQILAQVPDHRPSLLQAAKIHFDDSEYSQAQDYVQRLLAIDPGNPEYERMLGAVQLAAGRLDTGFGDMENVDLEDFTDPTILALLGTAYLRHGKIERGTESLERAKTLEPDSVPIRTQLAFGHMRAGKIKEAVRELEAVRKEDPGFLLAAVLQTFGYAALGRTDAAFEVANGLVEANPGAAIALNLRGYLHGAGGDVDAAKRDFNVAVESEPGFFPAYFNLARLALRDGDTETSKALLQKVLDQNPDEPNALLHLAALKIREKDRDGAMQLWLRAAKSNPDAIEPRVFLARHYRQLGDIRNAKRYAEEAYAAGSYVPAAQFEFATLKLISGEPEAAMPAIDALVERFPQAAVPLELKARAFELTGNIGSLKDTIERLMEVAPDSAQPRTAMVRLHLKRKEFEDAARVADELRNDERFRAEGYELIGDVRYAEGKFEQAAQAYRKAHELKPTSGTLLKVSTVERRLGGQSSEMVDEWLSANPDDAGVRVVQATTNLEQGKTALAIANYEKALASAPDNVIALNNLAWLYDEQDDERSLEYARRAYELAPGRPEVADTYGWVLYRAGKPEQALVLLRQAVQGDGANPDIRYHLASALAATGAESAALSELESILAADGQFPSRAEAETLRKTLGEKTGTAGGN